MDQDKAGDKYQFPQQKAAADILRSQIDRIYEGQNQQPIEHQHQHSVKADEEGLKKYHSAWQEYYQKYYEGIYNSPSNKASKQTETAEEAVTSIKNDLRSKLSAKSKKIKKSRHYKPLVAAATVIVVLLTLQYYTIILANIFAYISPGNINPQNIVINPIADDSVAPDPRIIIPKINVDAPVSYDIGNDYDSQMAAMSKGLAHFAIPGASSHPGEMGNTVIAGHSSNAIFEAGDYKFIFAGLDRLEAGDVIYANYNSKRYTYVVTHKETVEPTDVNKLEIGDSKPVLTLLTCTPLGTSRYRLLVFADQISPNPSKAIAASTSTAKQTSIPGTSPSFFEWVTSLFN